MSIFSDLLNLLALLLSLPSISFIDELKLSTRHVSDTPQKLEMLLFVAAPDVIAKDVRDRVKLKMDLNIDSNAAFEAEIADETQKDNDRRPNR